MKLYIHPASPNARKAAMAAAILGIPAETQVVDLMAGDQRKPAYLALNPNGRVPTLVIDGRVLTEVAGCLFYVARAFPAANLLPAGDVEAEAQVVSWMSFLASTVHPAVAQGPERVAEAWRIAEKKLSGKQWCVGEKYSIADIHLFRLYWRFKDRFGLKAADHPSVHALYDRMMQRPAVKKTIEAESKIQSSLPA